MRSPVPGIQTVCPCKSFWSTLHAWHPELCQNVGWSSGVSFGSFKSYSFGCFRVVFWVLFYSLYSLWSFKVLFCMTTCLFDVCWLEFVLRGEPAGVRLGTVCWSRWVAKSQSGSSDVLDCSNSSEMDLRGDLGELWVVTMVAFGKVQRGNILKSNFDWNENCMSAYGPWSGPWRLHNGIDGGLEICFLAFVSLVARTWCELSPDLCGFYWSISVQSWKKPGMFSRMTGGEDSMDLSQHRFLFIWCILKDGEWM